MDTINFKSQRGAFFSCFLFCSLFLATSSHADLVTYSGAFTVSYAPPGNTFNQNDRFDFEFVINDAVVDSNPQVIGVTRLGSFVDSIVSFSISANASNTGDWLGNTVYSISSPHDLFLNEAIHPSGTTIEEFGLQLTASEINLPGAHDGTTLRAFSSLTISYESAFSDFFSDTGSGQTLAEYFYGDVDLTGLQTDFSLIRFDDGASNYFVEIESVALTEVSTVAVVPVPAAAWLFLSASLGLLGLRRVTR